MSQRGMARGLSKHRKSRPRISNAALFSGRLINIESSLLLFFFLSVCRGKGRASESTNGGAWGRKAEEAELREAGVGWLFVCGHLPVGCFPLEATQ